MASIPALESFVIDGPPSALAARWKEWVDRLETYFAATAVENDQRRPMLLHLGGAAVHNLGRSVVEEGSPYTYQSLKQALTAHFEPLANPDYERFLLRQARQFPHESVDAFYARLKDLARTCTLVDVEDGVRAQFIQRCTSVKLREHILQVPGMSMVNILTLGRSKELSKVRAAHMEAALQTQVKVEPVNDVTTAPGERKKYKSKFPTSPRFCYSCGGPFPHQGVCLAQGKTCSNCQKLNHFAKVCKSVPRSRSQRFKAVHSVQPVVVMDDDDLDDDENGEEAPSTICINRQVWDTIPHVPECNDLHQQVGKALSRRKDRNDNMSRDICVGDMVLVKCRKGGSKFVLPFEKDPWIVSDVKCTMITAKRGSESITQNISFYKKVYASDFQVPIDISSWDQDYDDVTLQSPCLETNDVFPGGLLCPNMQSPGGSMALDHGTGQLVPMSSDVSGSGDHWVEEPITSRSGLAGPVTSTRGDGPYNLRPRPQCSTRLRDFVVN
ncbi:hypothetical protein NDU88_005926 [Pleurodeles waltl]|uniref:Retrotransposon gag domain-containing protein n=1 Tax=Pleurodeles waltl TaxID=8319 RepID=A0AAV7QG91_PLEWA|nr:hypothetical protein NDU88_005926 [Pleurodeles waltl]